MSENGIEKPRPKQLIVLQVVKTSDETEVYYFGEKGVVTHKKEAISFPEREIVWICEDECDESRTMLDIGDFLTKGARCDEFYLNCNIETALQIMAGEVPWQTDKFTFKEVERVYSTRIDCKGVPGRARRKAA